MVKPIGKKSIAAQVAEILPGKLKLFPAEQYKSHEGVRARASEAMAANPDLRLRCMYEPEGTYIIRLR